MLVHRMHAASRLAAASAEKTETEAARTEEEQTARQAEKDQAAATERERIWALGVETDAALAALPAGTIVAYTDGGHNIQI